jgi:ATP-dependent 26S proteasome regulatory subunit
MITTPEVCWYHMSCKIVSDGFVVRLLREELGLLQQPGSYVGEVVKVMGTKKVLVKVHPEGKYGKQLEKNSKPRY